MQELIKLISLVVLLICVICIFSARSIIRNKVERKDQNKVVLGMKVVCTIVLCIALYIIYIN